MTNDDLIIEVKGGVVTTVYLRSGPNKDLLGVANALGPGTRVVVRDWDDIESGEQDPLEDQE